VFKNLMPEISLPTSTFDRLLRRARAHGFTSVSEYLSDLADEPESEEFTLTPALSAALEEGLDDLRNGRMMGADAVREDVKRLGQEWRANND